MEPVSLPRLHVARHPLRNSTDFLQLYGKLEPFPWAQSVVVVQP